MKKYLVLLFAMAVVFCMSSVAVANLLFNAGFENNEPDPWIGSGFVSLPYNDNQELIHSGSQSSYIVNQGSVIQHFTLLDAPSHVFGVYYRIFTDSVSGNWDQIQTTFTINVSGISETVAISPGSQSSFKKYDSGWLSDWLLFEGEIDTSGMAGMDALINLNLQSYNGIRTAVAFDDAFVESAPVPVPTTMFLLGSGLVGLAGFRRKVKNA